jgi:MFS family permease
VTGSSGLPAGGGGRSGTTVWVASLGAAVVVSGIQGIAPAIPAFQEQFGLGAAAVSWVTSGYLLPSVFSAFLAGMLADRIGLRPVFAGSLAIFGLAAVVPLVEPSYALFMSVRALQGAAFGAVMSLSVGVIGSVASSGQMAARAQSRRSIAIAMGEALLPALGGLLLVFGWFAPFAMGLLALPLALASWLVLPPLPPGSREPRMGTGKALRNAPAIVEVQALGALRFITKYAVFTYYPVLAVHDVGMSPAAVGITLGASAVLTAGAAAMAEKFAHRWSASQLVTGSLALTGVSLAGFAATDLQVVVIAAVLLFGLQDGIFGVAHNVVVTEMAPGGAQSAYIGLTGTVRNAGKVTAPLAFGVVTLVASVSTGFLGLAATSLVSIVLSSRVGRTQAAMSATGGPRLE